MTEPMRSISDYLDVRLRDLALPEIVDQQLSGGLQVISFADGTRISVGPFASDTEIERAARGAFSKPLEHALTESIPSAVSPAAATADRMPPVDLAKPADTGPKMGPVSRALAPGSFAAGLRAMMDEARAGVARARADGLAKVGEAVSKLNDAKLATSHVAGSMASAIEDEAAAVMAELGQISNDLG